MVFHTHPPLTLTLTFLPPLTSPPHPLGVNFMRAACVIAVEKAKSSFEPMLEALRHRSVHIMRRLFPIVEHMVRKSGSNLPLDSYNKPCQEMIR